MVQEMVPDDVELGVLVEKWPFQKRFRVVSVVEKIGKDDVRSGCTSKSCKIRTDLIPHLEAAMQSLSQRIPNFNCGRYNLRTTETKIRRAEFAVLEVNGIMGFDLRAWVTPNPVLTVYYHERWYAKRLLVGLVNMALLRGYSPFSLAAVMVDTLWNAFECGDWEKMLTLYS
jgi:hypothetical protein